MIDLELTAVINRRIKRGNKLFFAKNDPFLEDLSLALSAYDHQTLILWAFEQCDIVIGKLSIDQTDLMTVINAWEICERWAKGEIKMPAAKAEILRTHAIAKRINNPQTIALIHAVGQGLSVVHTSKHALGLPIYELSAIVYAKGAEATDELYARKKEYLASLASVECRRPYFEKWADFIK